MTDDTSSSTSTPSETKNAPSTADVIAAASAPAVMPRNPPESEGFVTINPLLPVFRPLKTSHTLRGFPLCQQAMVDGNTYFLVQISKWSCSHCIRRKGYIEVEPGDLVLIADHPSLAGLLALFPIFRQQGSDQIADRGFEVIFTPELKYDGEAWSFELKARHLIGEPAKKIKRPPSFALPDLPVTD